MNQQLLLGILLVVVGIATGLVAVAVILNRRPEAETPDEGEADGGGSEAEPEDSDSTPDEGEAEGGGPETEVASPKPEVESLAAESGEHDPETESAAALAVMSADAAGESLLGELHRDPITGALFVRSGSNEFRSAADIPDRSSHERLASAAADLAGWFQQPAKREAPRPRPSASDMVQAIDAILQHSLENSGASARGVKLIQDASGGVKVLIGVKSYEVDQVPDKDIRKLIKQAVAEWEAHQ